MEFKGKEYTVEVLTENSFAGMDIGLFSPGGSVSEKFAPIAGKAGCVVIDNTSAFRMDPQVPLVVPEVNAHAIARYSNQEHHRQPQLLHDPDGRRPEADPRVARIKRVVVSTYQAVSGTGKRAIKELENQVLAIYGNREITKQVYPHQIAFNCLPHIDVFFENGYTKEEMKMVNETKKIMEDDSIRVTATTVRVPSFTATRIGQYRNREENHT